MHTDSDPALARLERLMIGHAAMVVALGLVAGFGLLFALLEEVAIWPLPALDVQIPGSARGWQAAHVGGLLNGVMVVAFALCLGRIGIAPRPARWVAWGLIYTAWANTVFYWLGNLAPNRGLSGGDTVHGDATLLGLLAYLPAATATVVTLGCTLAVARAAFASARGR